MDSGYISDAGAVLVAAYLGIGMETLNDVFGPVRQSHTEITGAVLWGVVKKLEGESKDSVTLAKETGLDITVIEQIQGEIAKIKVSRWS